MTRTYCIYLAGNIRKGSADQTEQAWDQSEKQALKEALGSLNVIFLDPSSRSDDLSDQESVFGRDMLQVFSSDLILVDARGKRGLGVGAEMMFAKLQGIPVVSWVPRESHYHRSKLEGFLGQDVEDWVHPFIFNLSDYVAHSIEEAAAWICEEYNIERKDPYESEGEILDAMQYYYYNQFPRDREMQAVAKEHLDLKERWDQLFTQSLAVQSHGCQSGGCGCR